MKKLMTVALVVSGLFYAGCDKKPADAAGEGTNAPAGALPAPGDAKEVVAKVGDVVLTRGEIDADEILSPYSDAIKSLALTLAINESMDNGGIPVKPAL
jgi:hypothetical protein